jgi:dodecin
MQDVPAHPASRAGQHAAYGSLSAFWPVSGIIALVTERLFSAGAGSKCSGKQRVSQGKGEQMSVARVTELSAVSETGFEDAIRQGVSRATSTLRGVEGAWIKDMNVLIEDGNVTGYKVNIEVTFVLEDS